MVSILCTRCGANGSDFSNLVEAKFKLQHDIGCGAKIGIPVYNITKTVSVEPTKDTTEAKEAPVAKPKKRKKNKKSD